MGSHPPRAQQCLLPKDPAPGRPHAQSARWLAVDRAFEGLALCSKGEAYCSASSGSFCTLSLGSSCLRAVVACI